MQLSRLERFLRLFTEVRPGEGVTAVLMFVNVFLLLCAYYFVKPLREAWLSVTDVMGLEPKEIKAYSTVAQVLVLLPIVAWYGRLVGNASALTPKHPVDIAGTLAGPVLGLYGEKDTGIPLDSVEKMKAALAAGSAAAKRSEFVVYPEAPHAFHADYRPSYRKEAAEDGWRRCVVWFRTHGVA